MTWKNFLRLILCCAIVLTFKSLFGIEVIVMGFVATWICKEWERWLKEN